MTLKEFILKTKKKVEQKKITKEQQWSLLWSPARGVVPAKLFKESKKRS